MLPRVYLPLNTPERSGPQGVTPSPIAAAIGMSSPSTVRSSSEYSICSAMSGAQPRKCAVSWAVATFQALTEEFPELPEPYNNLAVIWAQRGQYEKARAALESAIASNPDYAIAHENLGDIYSRLAGAEYDRAVALDKTNKSAQGKLVLVRQLYAVAPSSNAPKALTPVPKPAPPANDKK